MTGKTKCFIGFATALMGLASAGWLLAGQATEATSEGFPTDWTHHHVIYSQPVTAEQAQRVALDPRYRQQSYRLNFARTLALDGESESVASGLASTGRVKGFWSEDMGTGATSGADNYPAKYSFSTTAALCGNATTPDYVVFNTGLSGSATQASIVAYDNLYSGCTGTVPQTYWAYNTGGQVITSPATSLDGTQIAFTQTNGYLVLLKWAPSDGTISSPATNLAVVSNAAYRSCTAPCMTTLPLTTHSGVRVNAVASSSVFPDYGDDVIWVGGGSDWLFKFTGVFHGTPAESMSVFPVELNSNKEAVASPVYDAATGNVYVTDLGGYLYSVSPSGGITQSGRVDYAVGLVGGPVLDVTAGKVYVFSSDDNSTNCSGGPCAGVFSFSLGFTAGSVGTEVAVGKGATSSTGNPLFEGGFDYQYLISPNATGNLYVCGQPGGDAILYRVPVTTGALGSPLPVATLTTATDSCSPVTDVYNPNLANGGEEWVYVGVKAAGNPSGCTAGCAISYVDMPWTKSTKYNVGQEILVPVSGATYINVAITSGTSSGSAPAWMTAMGAVTIDGPLQWLNQGPTTVVPLAKWAATHTYAAPSRIVDSNGDVEVTTAGGTSAGSHPIWPTTAGDTVLDGSVTWTNAGAWPSSAQASSKGTSGIIIDNLVGSGGGSQVYFSTLGNQTCTTSGGSGGCAIQASQSGLN